MAFAILKDMANKMTIDKLALMVLKEFGEMRQYMDQRFERIEADINYLKKEVNHLKIEVSDIKLDVSYLKSEVRDIRSDVAEIKDQLIPKLEFEDLSERVKYMEEKMGIESGK